MQKLKVKVRQSHLNNAKQRDSHHCMIADAIHSADPLAKYVSVDLQSICWSHTETGERFVAFTPPKAQAALLRFDQGLKMSPFMFTAKVVEIRKVGWKANHPGTSRKGKTYKTTGRRLRKPKIFREFGLKTLAK